MSSLPIPKQVVVDVLIFVIVCLPLILFQALGKPVVTGFWCYDQSLSYPFKSDTVPQSLLLTVSFGIPFLVIAVTESIRAAVNSQISFTFRTEMMSLVKAYGVFLFGITVDCVFTDALKFSVGRLRPHFFDVCKPDFNKINCSADNGRERLFNQIVNRPATYPTDDKTNTLLDTRDMCGDVSKFDALIIVHTAVTHFEHRRNYRDTYGNFEFTRPYSLKIVFFLGQPTDPDLQSEILRENIQDGDTVQGNFTDTYRNLTYKAVMAFRWVSQNCHGVKVILKMDDDVILDVHRFFEEFVLPPVYQQELMYCHVWTLGEVERKGKWGVSLLDYKHDFYPPYCSGFIVVVMPAIVEDLYETARSTPFLWLDDVFIYGVVREEMKDIQLVNLDEVAFREEHYNACYRMYGYRCKYWATVLPQGKDFLSMLMSLRADRLHVLNLEQARQMNNIHRNRTWSTATSFPNNTQQFVTEYECTNTQLEQKWIQDSQLSFPSGHASVSLYSTAFTIFYLQMRMNVSFSHLLRPLIQMCIMIMALYCCVTRVTDHKHFATDVIAGSVLGVCLAWAMFYKIAYQVIPSQPTKQPSGLRRANSVESEPQTPTPLLRPDRIVIDHSYKDNVPVPGSKGNFVHKI